MEQTQFEQAVLRMVQQGGVQRLTPSAVAYQLRVSVKDAERMLDRMVTNAQLELDSDDEGNLFYFVPGHGTPGVFTAGTSAARPADMPLPSEAAARGSSTPQMPGAQFGATPSGASSSGGQPGAAPPYGQYAPGAGASAYTQGASGFGAPYGQSPPLQGAYAPPYGQYAPGQGGQAHSNSGQQGQYGQYAPYNQPGQYGAPNPYGRPPYGAPGAPYPGAPYGGQPAGGPPGPPPPGPPPPAGGASQYGQPYSPPAPGFIPPGAPGTYGQQGYAYGHNALVPTSGPNVPRSPSTAALLGLVPGAGQLYNGQVGKGLTIFFVTALLSATPFAVIPWLWGIVDAHNTAKRQNAQQHYGLLGP